MSPENEESDILKRLRALEEENAHLRHLAKSYNVAKTLTVTEGEYKGYPTLTFEGPFRSFTLGITKLTYLKQAWPEVESFLQRHAQKKSGQNPTDDDDVKI
jgi:hypothetical protein